MKVSNFKSIGLIIISVLLYLSSFSQIPDDVVLSLQTGDAAALAKFFNKNIELVVIDKDDVYSKAQAQQIVSEFFQNHQAERFNIIHEGGKEGARYGIGNLSTNKGVFRVSFLLKSEGGKSYIHQLRIEKQ
ncbi:DUF4783 domain-containing protein [Sunxiuqinia sp. A32]|uniref:DUF4783 domain-containing protein n=1 Tax=Sunxiuqinia sp. A32 TaxID=3461496 RepID=UPI004046303A